MKEKIKAVVVGYGDRGSIYANYAIEAPDDLEIVGVCDIDPNRLAIAKNKFNLRDDQLFDDFEKLLKRGKIADAAFVTTMDKLHYYQTKELLNLGYNILLEKPVVNNKKELLELQSLAEQKKLIISVGHVLRYTPFYQNIKKRVLNGDIGEIIYMETSERVGVAHTSSAFARGKWKNKEECGSSMLLQKCCHDLDLICWLNNNTEPLKIVSFGSRSNVIKDKAPAGSTERCYDCPHLETCIYSAKSLYVDNDIFPFYSFLQLRNQGKKDLTKEEREKAIKDGDPFGVCIYKTNADIVDHQSLMIMFKNNSIAVHNMISFVPRPGRSIHILGTKGEIEGFFEKNIFEIRKENFATSFYDTEVVDVSKLVDPSISHGGGDLGLIKDFVHLLQKDEPSVSTSSLKDSIISHLCVYAADESMEKNEIEFL